MHSLTSVPIGLISVLYIHWGKSHKSMASDDVNVLYAKDFWELNQYIAMFIITVIKANKYRFGYGRKWTLEKMKDTVIKLPGKKDGLRLHSHYN